jgi:ubiquinone/menaquinone biosynthesis C-methylase UbiE
MTEHIAPHTVAVKEMYDVQAAEYAEFQDSSFAWLYIERPAFDRYLTSDYLPSLSNLYQPHTSVLDLACGSGTVMRHLLSRGIKAENIVGVDISEGQLQKAQDLTSRASFVQASANKLPFSKDSLDLVTCNMALHYLDKEQLTAALDDMYRVLKPNGTVFFVAPDPDHDAESRDPTNVNTWLRKPTPWGGEALWYSRDPYELLLDQIYFGGFDLVAGGPLPVSEEGKVDPELYQRYANKPSRIAARLQKVSPQEKQRRIESIGKEIPALIV